MSGERERTVQCGCGRRVPLDDPLTNACACGREYSGTGQLLAPDWRYRVVESGEATADEVGLSSWDD